MVEPPETERIREMERFVTDVFKGLMPMPSNTPALTVDAQRTFETKLRKAIEIALSKYQPVKVPDTLFSKKQLLPSCAACGRATLQQPREQAPADAGPEDEPQAPDTSVKRAAFHDATRLTAAQHRDRSKQCAKRRDFRRKHGHYVPSLQTDCRFKMPKAVRFSFT